MPVRRLAAVCCVLWLGWAGIAGGAPRFPMEAGPGVNLSGIFAQSPRDPRVWGERLVSLPTERILRAGFRVVRLPVDPEALWDGEGRLLTDRVAAVTEAVERWVRGGLVVVVDLHPYPHMVREILRGGDAAARHRRLLSSLARRLGTLREDRVVLEPLNEPFDVPAKRWSRLQEGYLRAVRAEAPRLWVGLSGARWGSLEGLLELDPPKEDRLVAGFHYYDPHPFTHQGADWGPGAWRELRDVPYPPRGTPKEALSPEVRGLLRDYASRSWGEGPHRAALDAARKWSDRTGIPVWCAEFGATASSPPADRARWLGEVRRALESLGVPWCVWEGRGTFGVLDRPREAERLRRALGVSLRGFTGGTR